MLYGTLRYYTSVKHDLLHHVFLLYSIMASHIPSHFIVLRVTTHAQDIVWNIFWTVYVPYFCHVY